MYYTLSLGLKLGKEYLFKDGRSFCVTNKRKIKFVDIRNSIK